MDPILKFQAESTRAIRRQNHGRARSSFNILRMLLKCCCTKGATATACLMCIPSFTTFFKTQTKLLNGDVSTHESYPTEPLGACENGRHIHMIGGFSPHCPHLDLSPLSLQVTSDLCFPTGRANLIPPSLSPPRSKDATRA